MIVAAAPAFATRAANPYNSLLYDAVAAHGVEVREYQPAGLLRHRPDIVHLHWPELTFLSSHRALQSRARLARFEATIRMARARGTRLVWTMHNDGAHEAGDSALPRRLDRLLEETLDAAFALSTAGERAFRERFGDDIPVFLTPHGHYRTAYPLDRDRAVARAVVGIDPDATVLAAIGQIRPYKNLPALASALRDITDPSLRVVIAGHTADHDELRVLRDGADVDPRLTLEPARLDEARMATWLRAADGVVLPYRRILNSGAAMLALSAGRPVVVPALGAMPELARAVGGDWVHTYEGEFTGAVLADAVAWLRETVRPPAPDLSAFDWDPIAAATIEGYERVLAAPRRQPTRRQPTRKGTP